MADEQRKASLSAPRRRIVELMQEIVFGWMEVRKRQGEPVLDPPPRVVKKIKLGVAVGQRPERNRRDFLLKDRVVSLFAEFDRLGEGATMTILVQHGLPFMVETEELKKE